MPRKQKSKRISFSDSFLLKYGLKVILSFIVIVVFLTAVQCNIEKPEAPTWNTQMVIPVVNRVYHMDEIIEKIDAKIQLSRLVIKLPIDRLERSINQHISIVQALRSRDRDLSELLMQHHIMHQLSHF